MWCQVPSGKPEVMADQTPANKELIAPPWDPTICEFGFFSDLSHPVPNTERMVDPIPIGINVLQVELLSSFCPVPTLDSFNTALVRKGAVH